MSAQSFCTFFLGGFIGQALMGNPLRYSVAASVSIAAVLTFIEWRLPRRSVHSSNNPTEKNNG